MAGVDDIVSERKPREHHIMIRSLIPNKVVGGLIGKGGENIKIIRSACPEATIKVLETPECPHAEERILQVECEPSEIYALFSQLIPQIFDGLKKNGFNNVREPEICSLFSSVNMGSIIGKGGHSISNIRQGSGAFLKAYPNKLQNSDERVLLIRGEVDKVINALSQIYTSVELETAPYNLYNPADGVSMPRDAGVGGYQDCVDGFDSGLRKPQRGGRGGGGGRGGSFGPPPPFRKPGQDFYSSQGNQQPRHGGYGPPSHHQDYQQQPRFDGGEQEEVGGLLSKFIVKYPFTTYTGPDGEENAVKEVTLENNLTGCVIGDKGARVRDVRQSSGARIRIGEFDSAGPSERLITIEGTNIQCHLAEYMLQCCVQSFSGRPQGNKPPQNAPPRKKLKANHAPSGQDYPWDSATQQPQQYW